MQKDISLLQNVDFGDDSADDAPIDDLMGYFVEQNSFSTFVNFGKRFEIIKARKGTGKSAILRWIAHEAKKESGNIVINCRGCELVRERFKLPPLENTDPNSLIYDWMSRICTIINREIAKRVTFAFSDQKMSMIATAELEGFKEKNIISALLDRLSPQISISNINLGSNNKEKIVNEIETLRREKNVKAIIIIDDLDATFQNTPEECLNLSSFFSACRYLIQDFPGIVIRTSIRNDVWPLIRPKDEAMDKVEQYIFNISWTEKDFVQLLNKRIAYSFHQKSLDDIFSNYFNWGGKQVKNYVCIYTLSYERPRWAIQLCKLSQKIAIQKNHNKITLGDIEQAWVEYSKLRIADLESEHKHQCTKIGDIVNVFRGQLSRFTLPDLEKIISDNITSRLAVCIDGETTRTPSVIAKFLYRIGFIVARTQDGENYFHYAYEDLSSLIDNRFQKDDEFEWEIHPCYRKALDIRSLNEHVRKQSNRNPNKKNVINN